MLSLTFASKANNMLTKYKLSIGTTDYELQDSDLKNWDEIECVFKRTDFGGVTRSFTSKFEFSNEAYRLLMQEYDAKDFNASATITFYVINDNWQYEILFQCDLDFSTLTYTEHVLSINAIDNSIASRIKVAKSTKFEFLVGEDVPVWGKYMFDRLRIIETATYEITDGTSNSDGSLTGEYKKSSNYRIYVGQISNEISVGGSLILQEDQTHGDGYLFLAKKDVEISLDYSIAAGIQEGCAPIFLMKNDTEIKQLHSGVEKHPMLVEAEQSSIQAVKDYINSMEYLRSLWNTGRLEGYWVVVNGIVWTVIRDALNSSEWYNTGKTRAEYEAVPSEGTVTFQVSPDDKVWLKFASEDARTFKFMSSSLQFTWQARGATAAIDYITPEELLTCLLSKMDINCDCVISEYDDRISKTLLLAAESIRDIPGAKVYISFNDFCNWMETVFGYIYIVDEDSGVLEFKHRKELFSNQVEIVEIQNAKDFNYKIEKSVLFSSVTIGYEKKDYDSVNGRDEFNFNSSYTTGYTLSEKKLELKSPFRADSYGIEFLVEKRGQNTTDNNSDKDIFFVTGKLKNGEYITNHQPVIVGSITGTLINGEFSPVQCVLANSDYITIMSNYMKLAFASTEGNANIVIDNWGMSEDLVFIDNDMLTAGELSFVCDDLGLPDDVNCLIRVKSQDFVYEGFIRQVSFALSKPEEVEYTIMIKSKQPCS